MPGDDGETGNDAPMLTTEATAQPGFGERSSATQAASASTVKLRYAWGNWALLGVSILVLLAIIGGVFYWFRPLPKTPAQIAIDPQSLGLGCLAGEAWSRDSSQVAILGAQHFCNFGQAPNTVYSNEIAIIDPMTGKLVKSILPDPVVQVALHQRSIPTPQAIHYDGIIWSPDGKHIALPFSVQYQNATVNGAGASSDTIGVIYGLNVVSVSGNSTSAYIIPDADLLRFTGVWNLNSGQPVLYPSIPNASSQLGHAQYPAAQRFTWQADGTLVADAPLTTSSAGQPITGPIGNPDGDASFMFWQSVGLGQFTGQTAGSSQQPITPAPLTLQSHQLAWSPDGAYLMDGFAGPWRVQASKRQVPGPAQLAATYTQNMPLIPVRDAALDTELNALPELLKSASFYGFAWSPNGRMLGALSASQGNNGNNATLRIRECASGKLLATLNLHGSSLIDGVTYTDGGMEWAPNGQRLLVNANKMLFLVEPSALPQA